MSQKVYSQSWTYSPTARDWYFCPGRRLIGSPSSDDAALVHSDAVDADAAEMTKLVSHTAGRWWPGGRRASVEDGAAYDKDGLHAFTPAIHASSCRKWPASGVKCELWGGPLPECSRPATGDPSVPGRVTCSLKGSWQRRNASSWLAERQGAKPWRW